MGGEHHTAGQIQENNIPPVAHFASNLTFPKGLHTTTHLSQEMIVRDQRAAIPVWRNKVFKPDNICDTKKTLFPNNLLNHRGNIVSTYHKLRQCSPQRRTLGVQEWSNQNTGCIHWWCWRKQSLQDQQLQDWPRSSSEGVGVSWTLLWPPRRDRWWRLITQPQLTSRALKDCKPILEQCGNWDPQRDLKGEKAIWYLVYSFESHVVQ